MLQPPSSGGNDQIHLLAVSRICRNGSVWSTITFDFGLISLMEADRRILILKSNIRMVKIMIFYWYVAVLQDFTAGLDFYYFIALCCIAARCNVVSCVV